MPSVEFHLPLLSPATFRLFINYLCYLAVAAAVAAAAIAAATAVVAVDSLAPYSPTLLSFATVNLRPTSLLPRHARPRRLLTLIQAIHHFWSRSVLSQLHLHILISCPFCTKPSFGSCYIPARSYFIFQRI